MDVLFGQASLQAIDGNPMAASGSLTLVLGETWSIVVSCHDANGAALDLTGATTELRIATCGAVVEDVAGVLSDTPTDGIVTFPISPADQVVANYNPSVIYQMEIRVTLADGSITDQFQGQLYVQPSLFTGTQCC